MPNEAGAGQAGTFQAGGAAGSYTVTMSATATGAASFQSMIVRTLSASSTCTATLSKLKVKLVILVASVTGSPSISRALAVTVGATSVATAVFVRFLTRTMRATSTAFASVTHPNVSLLPPILKAVVKRIAPGIFTTKEVKE